MNLMAKNAKKNNKGLVDISAIDAAIIIDLKYACSDNIFGKPLYEENKAYLRKPTAEKLAAANNKLKQKGLGLKVWDAYRPLFVQKMMWKLKPDANFVANPEKGSVHNKGCAVDVTLVDKDGNDVPMPTKFDDFSVKAKADYENLPGEVIANREILKEALMSSGFSQYKNEWWHFADTDSKKFTALNVSFEKLAAETT